MKKKYIIIVFILILFFIVYSNISIKEKIPSINYINIFLQISNNSSYNTEGDNVYFISPVEKIIKGNIIITNNENKTSKIDIIAEGEIAENNWLNLTEKKFKISPNETKQITISIEIPKNASGNYTSKLKIESR